MSVSSLVERVVNRVCENKGLQKIKSRAMTIFAKQLPWWQDCRCSCTDYFCGVLLIYCIESGISLDCMMMKMTKKWHLLVVCFFPLLLSAQPFSYDAKYEVCFTPGQDCSLKLIQEVEKERKAIWIQAYSFTSAPIARALVYAKNRGVEVKVILDKSQFKAEKYSASKFLDNQGIPVWIDAKPAIAHNKTFIFSETVATGSFNFTKAAQEKNAENLLIIHDSRLTQQYRNNWIKRQKESIPLADYSRRNIRKGIVF